MTQEKTVLFVTYGAGHAQMVIPVIRELEKQPHIRVVTLALTLAGPMFTNAGLAYLGFRDVISAEDTEALAWGRRLAAGQPKPDSGIGEEETIAYLGLSYWNLVQAHGEAEAAKLWQAQGRQAFLPLVALERVIARVKPDLVVATNSPRAERAAVEVANAKGIPTLCMVDLIGIQHFHALESTYITVLMAPAIENMLAEGVKRPKDAFHITGNPAFDRALDFSGPREAAWRAAHFPGLAQNAKTLLWIDVSAYWDMEKLVLHIRSEDEILRDLDMVAQATLAQGVCMLLRPHPTQRKELFLQWIQNCGYEHVFFAGHVPLHPLLHDVDVVATYNSTVALEAVLMRRRVVMLKYYNAMHDLPLGEWGVAWLAQNPEAFAACVGEALHDDAASMKKQQLADELLPQERAAPKVAALIGGILAGRVCATK